MLKIKTSLTTFLISTTIFMTTILSPNPAKAAESYTVVHGDTLYSIAQIYGTSVNTLKTANHLSSDLIKLSQVLIIPNSITQPGSKEAVSPSSQQAAKGKLEAWQNDNTLLKYTVIRGDSLYSIAQKFKTSVEALKTANHLSSYVLNIGQNLTIPNSIAQPVSRGAVNRPLPTTGEITKGKLVAWQNVHPWFKEGTTAVLKDVATGRQFQIYRLFGTNHADCEPLTAQDAQIMKEIYGGQWSWTRRAVILIYNGQAIAASMNGMPHGSCHIKNNGFNGHFCLHFLNSRTHGTNKPDPDHQRMIHRAAGE